MLLQKSDLELISELSIDLSKALFIVTLGLPSLVNIFNSLLFAKTLTLAVVFFILALISKRKQYDNFS